MGSRYLAALAQRTVPTAMWQWCGLEGASMLESWQRARLSGVRRHNPSSMSLA